MRRDFTTWIGDIEPTRAQNGERVSRDILLKRAVITVGEQMDERMKYHLLLPLKTFNPLYDVALVKVELLTY
jgi:hypothetical protein